MVYLYYLEVIGVFLYVWRTKRTEGTPRENKSLQSLVNHHLFWHLMWAKTVGAAQALQGYEVKG